MDEKDNSDIFNVMPLAISLWSGVKSSMAPLIMLPVLIFLVITNLIIVIPTFFLVLLLQKMIAVISRTISTIQQSIEKIKKEFR